MEIQTRCKILEQNFGKLCIYIEGGDASLTEKTGYLSDLPYIGTEIGFNPTDADNMRMKEYAFIQSVKLILKPLSSITDEDAIEVAKIVHKKYGKLEDGKDFINDINECHNQTEGFTLLAVFQFLQSKGYDLPQYLLGGKTLFEVGLCIYE